MPFTLFAHTMSRTKKLVRQPGVFFRDYFNSKYPVVNCEQKVVESKEPSVIESGLALAELEQQVWLKPFDIDVVFTWVDNRDQAWQQRYQAHNNAQGEAALYANDAARFTNHNELYYSLHSVRKYLPWVRNIYVVTDHQTPSWFSQEKYPNVHIVDHTDIIPTQYLPTFNSHVIEAHIHKIPGLSENFLYFNDDVFVARPLPKEHFFHSNGIASIFVADKSLVAMQKKGILTPTLSASQNSINLLQKHYHVGIDSPLVHTYMPLKRSVFERAWQIYHDDIVAFLPNKLRTNEDLNMATFLVPWLMYLSQKSVPAHDVCYYFNIRSAHAKTQYRKLLQSQRGHTPPHSFCANDFNSVQSDPNYHANLELLLKKYYKL